MSNKLEIILSQVNETPVKLASMSSDALDSFMIMVSALKTISECTVTSNELRFSILEGSALCSVEAPDDLMDSVYNELELAIQGKSEDKEITKQLRIIQEQLKDDSYKYQFRYKANSDIKNLDKILRSSKRITTKRKKRAPFEYKLIVKKGLLNQIGGKNPNYHFDFGQADSITIDCSKQDAINVINYLYQDVHALLMTKEWTSHSKRDEYFHKLILSERLVPKFKSFVRSYYLEDDLVDRLTVIHDYVDEQFEKSSEDGFEFLESLIIAFNDKNFHISELKTLLIISKPFRNNSNFKRLRNELLSTYNNKRLDV